MTEKSLDIEDSKFIKILKKYSTIIIFILSLIACIIVYLSNKEMGIFEFILVMSWFIPSIVKDILKHD